MVGSHFMPINAGFLEKEDIELEVADRLAKLFVFAFGRVRFGAQTLGIWGKVINIKTPNAEAATLLLPGCITKIRFIRVSYINSVTAWRKAVRPRPSLGRA